MKSLLLEIRQPAMFTDEKERARKKEAGTGNPKWERYFREERVC